MMPNMQMPAPPPSGPAPSQMGDRVSPDEIKAKLLQLLQKAQQMAEANGLDFSAIIREFLRGSGPGQGPSAPPPPPPARG